MADSADPKHHLLATDPHRVRHQIRGAGIDDGSDGKKLQIGFLSFLEVTKKGPDGPDRTSDLGRGLAGSLSDVRTLRFASWSARLLLKRTHSSSPLPPKKFWPGL